jgi:two-component system, NarL family, nitrate/nitrite response regulator NarL
MHKIEHQKSSLLASQNAVTLILELGVRPSEAKVAALLMQGDCNKVIARQLNISESTVKCHVVALFRLLNLQNRVQLARRLHLHVYRLDV